MCICSLLTWYDFETSFQEMCFKLDGSVNGYDDSSDFRVQMCWFKSSVSAIFLSQTGVFVFQWFPEHYLQLQSNSLIMKEAHIVLTASLGKFCPVHTGTQNV